LLTNLQRQNIKKNRKMKITNTSMK